MRLSKLSALAQSGLMLWAAYEHGDEMLFDGIGSSPTEWAWIVFQLRQADDNPELVSERQVRDDPGHRNGLIRGSPRAAEGRQEMNVRIEPERPEDRNTRFHMRIMGTERIQGTRTGNWADLECGHRVMIFGNIEMAGGKALFMECRDK